MKSLFILVLIALLSTSLNAQTFAEWFKQGATQKKYLLKQIAALQLYIDYVQKGYSIAQKGLTFINNIKNRDLKLHRNYFNSLTTVNLKIRKYSKVADIITFQLKIINVYKNASRQLVQCRAFDADELKYLNEVFNRLIEDCLCTIDELIVIITNNKLEMKDDERLQRIDALYNDMQADYSFAQNFAGESKILAAARLREQNDIQTSRAINGIKN